MCFQYPRLFRISLGAPTTRRLEESPTLEGLVAHGLWRLKSAALPRTAFSGSRAVFPCSSQIQRAFGRGRDPAGGDLHSP